MARTELYVDPGAGNDWPGTTFTDANWTASSKTVTKTGAFTAANAKVGARLYLTGTGVTAGYYVIATRPNDDSVTLVTSLAAGDLTGVVSCTQHDGTVTLPWASLQFCMYYNTFDVTNGTRINLKAGTANVLAAALNTATVFVAGGAPSYNNEGLIIQGYTAAAGDGGIGEINGGGAYGLFATTNLNGVFLVDLHIHNSGSAKIVQMSDYGGIYNCEIHNSTGTLADVANCTVANCYLYDGGASAISANGALIYGNYISNGAKSFTDALYLGAGRAYRNILSLSGNSSGIYVVSNQSNVMHNSVFSSAGGTGTGKGIYFYGSAYGIHNLTATNNLVEGFSVNIAPNSYANPYTIVGNAVFNGGTNYGADTAGKVTIATDEDNETLLATPFAKSGANSFANRFTYFAPVAAVQGTAYPSGCRLDKGAVQHADPAGGGIWMSRPRQVGV